MDMLNDYYECGDGWLSLIEEGKSIVEKYNNEHPELEFPLEFTQIKEKWGGLYMYLNQHIPEINDKIRDLLLDSYNVCEQCGTRKNVSKEWTHGWVMTLCDECRKKEIETFNEKL